MIGTGGTGKTTVATLLASQISEPFVSGVLRPLMQKQDITCEKIQLMSDVDRWKFQKEAFDRKMRQDKDHVDGIFDRTLLCHFAYCILLCNNTIPEPMCKSMMILVQENLMKYDIVYYFPLYDWGIENDSMRFNNFASRLAHNMILQGIIKELGLNCIHISDKSPEMRVRFILNELRREGYL